MDILAALALVLMIEGLALVIFAKSLPELIAQIEQIGPGTLRFMGLASLALGAVSYMFIRGA